jgi:small ligand-binding sensory domain FIST
MRWASAISTNDTLDQALAECAISLGAQLGGAEPDLVTIFAAPALDGQLMSLNTQVRPLFPNAIIVGCTGAGVIGAGMEMEATPAISITAAVLPGVALAPFHLSDDALPSPDAPPDDWGRAVGVEPGSDPHFILLADPFTMDSQALLAGLDYAFPAAAKIGGLASGGASVGAHTLYLNHEVHSSGAVGIALSGNIVVDTVVAQGCRPIGKPMRVTGADRNMLLSADGRPPMETLQEMFEHADAGERDRIQRNLFMGIAMDPLLDSAQAGDFLIRNIVGADAERGAITVGGLLNEGQLVQFHVRDADTSAEDLRNALAGYLREAGDRHAAAALLFQCTGRGQYLYGREGHDTDVFNEMIGAVPLGGFFCNGEIGPVAGTTYLHAYTSSFAIFRERMTAD